MQHYETLCNMVIRPPRYTYELDDMGPKLFKIDGQRYLRKDFELINARGHTLQCSHFVQSDYWETPGEKQPCVIYCHGNSGCRLDALESVRELLPKNITILAFDFSGSGLSGGEYVSLGFYEKDDLSTVVKYLRETEKISTIGLWGRSMGAVTSILYAKEDPSIAGMVLDSPFSSLYKVAEELVQSNAQKIPKLMISLALKMIRSSIKKRAHFDIKDLDICNITSQVFIPALFAHGKEDTFVRPHHSEILHKNYQGDKNIILVDGDHNCERPPHFKDSVFIFFVNTLKPTLPIANNREGIQSSIYSTHNLHGHALPSKSLFEDSISSREQRELEQAILMSMSLVDNIEDLTTTTTTRATTTTTTEPTDNGTKKNEYEYFDDNADYDQDTLKQQEELYNSFKNHSLSPPGLSPTPTPTTTKTAITDATFVNTNTISNESTTTTTTNTKK